MGVILLVASVLVILVLKYLPIRRATLIEGVFSHKKQDHDLFSRERFAIYYFDYACRECWEKNREGSSLDECHTAIPEKAFRLSSVKPVKGDSVKIIGYKNIFGWVRAYKIVSTNFAKKFAEKQFAKEEREQKEHDEAFDQRMALHEGFSSVDKYRQDREEKDITERVKILGISREDVVANK